MGDEYIFSGYCRAQDQSRMVTVETENGTLQADCCYGNCPYEQNCTIAQQIAEIK